MNLSNNHSATTHLDPPSRWETAETLQLLIEAAPIAIVTINSAGQIQYVNQKLEELFGYVRSELIGNEVEILLPELLRATHIQHRDRYIVDPQVRAMGSGMDLIGRRQDGSEFILEAGLSAVQIEDQQFIMASIINITARRQAEEMLEDRVKERTVELERRRRVADGLRDILEILNSDQSLDETLDYMLAQVGMLLDAEGCAIFRAEEKTNTVEVHASQGLCSDYLQQANSVLNGETFVGRAIVNRHPVTIPNIAATLEKASVESSNRSRTLLKCGYNAFIIVPIIIRGHTYGALALYYTQLHTFSDEEVDLASTFADQVGLAIENARLRIQAEEAAVMAERSRIARDLHDSVTQTLFSANMIADILPRLWDRNEALGRQRLGELHELTRGALAEMRTMLLELRPAMLQDAALDEVLQQLVDATTNRARLPIDLEIQGECNNLPSEVRFVLYRIAQEALNNVAKHAAATGGTVTLHCLPEHDYLPEHIKLTVEDNGAGFIFEQRSSSHQGLKIMQERAADIGAALTIKSQPGKGTSISVHWSNHSTSTQQEKNS